MTKKSLKNLQADGNPPAPEENKGKEIPAGSSKLSEEEINGSGIPKEGTPPTPDENNGKENQESGTHPDSEDSETQTKLEDELIRLVVYADSDAAEMLKAIWDKNCNVENIVWVAPPESEIRELVEDCIADNKIAQRFVFVPANTIPCSTISFEELHIPIVYIGKDNKEQFNHRLPMYFDKEKLVEYLASTDEVGEAFIKGYVDRYCSRPVQVGFQFGNYVMPVMRGNPCENIVIEGLLKRKFITASSEGFAAIKKLLNTTILK